MLPPENESETEAFEDVDSEETSKRVKPFDCKVGYQTYRVEEAWTVPGTRKKLAAILCPWSGEWAVIDRQSNRAIIHGSPSRKYALKLMARIMPRLNLERLLRGLWNDSRDAIPEEVLGYLQHVWLVSYSMDELPTVKQWQKSGLKNSHQKLNPCRGKMMVKRRK